ncbi:hypothetical protein IGK74_002332 [Enterococcus sp. AZ150]|uniref:hypothetical protein n=1 Tax=Enterococcus sp. AZ150 TaxID=2774866 RepID=UPI003F25DA43
MAKKPSVNNKVKSLKTYQEKREKLEKELEQIQKQALQEEQEFKNLFVDLYLENRRLRNKPHDLVEISMEFEKHNKQLLEEKKAGQNHNQE